MTESERRPTRPRTTFAEVLPLAVVVAGMIAGLVVVFLGYWEPGCLVIGVALTIGGFERLLLPNDKAGLLQARSRFFDVVALFGMGAAIIVLAVAVPSA
jgi:hypothetical protein